MAEWLCSGLQSRVPRFDSGSRLQCFVRFEHLSGPDGEIGRHKGLKIPRRKPYRFDSGSGHQPLKLVIVLNLLCDQGHRFEGWFASGEAFRDQSQRRLVHCPQCQTSGISQLPSAPHVKRAATEVAILEKATTPASAPAMVQLHQALISMARKAENVGERFPEEARRIHYDEAPARSIRGVATQDETRDLLEEGIAVLPAPVPPEDELH
jgi:hypothetical protein